METGGCSACCAISSRRPLPVQLVYPEGHNAAAKVRAFIDFAAQRLRVHPALIEERCHAFHGRSS